MIALTLIVVATILAAGWIEIDSRRAAAADDAFDEHVDQALALGNESLSLYDAIARTMAAGLDDELADLLGGQ